MAYDHDNGIRLPAGDNAAIAHLLGEMRAATAKLHEILGSYLQGHHGLAVPPEDRQENEINLSDDDDAAAARLRLEFFVAKAKIEDILSSYLQGRHRLAVAPGDYQLSKDDSIIFLQAEVDSPLLWYRQVCAAYDYRNGIFYVCMCGIPDSALERSSPT